MNWNFQEWVRIHGQPLSFLWFCFCFYWCGLLLLLYNDHDRPTSITVRVDRLTLIWWIGICASSYAWNRMCYVLLSDGVLHLSRWSRWIGKLRCWAVLHTLSDIIRELFCQCSRITVTNCKYCTEASMEGDFDTVSYNLVILYLETLFYRSKDILIGKRVLVQLFTIYARNHVSHVVILSLVATRRNIPTYKTVTAQT